MGTAMPLLLCLLSALVEVHSKAVPYVSFMGTIELKILLQAAKCELRFALGVESSWID